MEEDMGASAEPTGLAGAEALEPHSRLHPSDGIPSAAFEHYLRRGRADFHNVLIPDEINVRIDAAWEANELDGSQPPSVFVELYANPAASSAMLADPHFDVVSWFVYEVAHEFSRAGRPEFRYRPTRILRDPYTHKPFVHFYVTRAIAAAARQGGDAERAPAESPQSGDSKAGASPKLHPGGLNDSR